MFEPHTKKVLPAREDCACLTCNTPVQVNASQKTDIGIKDIQSPFLMVARGRAWGQVKEKKKKIWLSGKEALAVCYLKTK